jgi:hypothetical protein
MKSSILKLHSSTKTTSSLPARFQNSDKQLSKIIPLIMRRFKYKEDKM